MNGSLLDRKALAETGQPGQKEPAIHFGQRLGDLQPERHVGENVPLERHAGSDLREAQPGIGEFEHRAFRDIGDPLVAPAPREWAVERDVTDVLDELAVLALPNNSDSGLRDLDPKSASREGAREHDVLGVLADVDEPAHAHDLISEPRDVNAAPGVYFRRREKGDVEPAAVVEIELIGLIDHREVVSRRAGLEAA